MSNIQVIEKDIFALRERFGSVLSDQSISFDREAEFAVQILSQNDYALGIAMKNRQSAIDAVTNVAAIGVSLNPAKKHAYLVPRDGKICLDISYMGLLSIATDSGSIKWGQARVVHEQDVFEVNGIDREPTHRYQPFAKERGAVVGAYCVVKTRDGDYLTEAMSIDEINDIRDRSASWKAWIEKKRKSPWVTDENEMRKKTVVKRAHKYWPSTERLAKAIHYLNTDGGEGLSDQPSSPLAAEWIAKVAEQTTTEGLTEIWRSGVKVFNQAKDKDGAEAFKQAVKERGAAIKLHDEARTTEAA